MDSLHPLRKLKRSEVVSLKYHCKFEYPLYPGELVKWQAGPKVRLSSRDNLGDLDFWRFAKERKKREKYSLQKLRIARRAASVLRLIPTVRFVGITGSLAMMNAKKDSDIDLMIIASQGTLWITRLFSYFVLCISNFSLRRAGDRNEENKLCLNLWMDESELVWRQRNTFTAHEIAQIVPLVNKGGVYQRFLWSNRWILDYWPKAVRIEKVRTSLKRTLFQRCLQPFFCYFEKAAFFLQYRYMRSKITNEVVTPSRAQFHPVSRG